MVIQGEIKFSTVLYLPHSGRIMQNYCLRGKLIVTPLYADNLSGYCIFDIQSLY